MKDIDHRIPANYGGCMTLTTVGLLATEPVSLFEFSVVAEIFGIDRTDDGCPPFEFRVCAADPSRPLATKTTAPGLTITATHDLTGLAGCDLVVLGASPIEPDGSPIRPVPAEITDALLACADAGATLLSVCTGAFLLASTGLLDGRTCATHWMYADELGRRHPHVIVDADSLYVDEGRLITSAGTAAGIDACLHLVRRELGTAVATRIARRMVVPPHRDGGQQQYVDRPVPTPRATASPVSSTG
ncbi:hypothetical protein GCM10025862_14960 [Arsenicicoccus piscis]|uniref:DJ-1/PfpI domain-containing protein n=1 Tax=Arsenicicoccus piscis TaxID=673954 RepID=A0ABQ6HMW7_9MICO|nr:hypothetical protein GCM10025862_14960 [Arsenicicoccus piscis]